MNPISLKSSPGWCLLLVVIMLITGCGEKSPETEAKPARVNSASSADGVPISYEVHGAGNLALVFIHGWSCDRSYWEAQLEPFSNEFQVVTVDLAGHGESGTWRQTWTIKAYGEDVAAVAEELDLKRMILIGHSMGGDVAVAAARLLQERVEGLVWVDTYSQLGNPRTREQIQEIVSPFRDNFEETTYTRVRDILFCPDSDVALVERVANDMASAPPEVAIESLESSFIFGRTITSSLQELRSPVVAINPDRHPTDIESMKRYGVDVILMPGVGHFLMMEDPEEFNRLLSEVINKFIQ